MPRWIARPVLGLLCLPGVILPMLTWAAGPGRAEMLSTGVLSDQPDQPAASPAIRWIRRTPPPVAPFAGLKPPSADAATGSALPRTPW